MRLIAAFLLVSLVACTPAVPTDIDEVVAAESTPQPSSMVDLTLYFRHGRGEHSYLEPVKQEVSVTQDLPKTALRLLLDGPVDETSGLIAPLPATTQIKSFTVDDQTARVDLSRDLIADAGTVGVRPEHEYLALAAIANTLTEFPAISSVELTVDGRAGGRFWGGWGLPDQLVRDETVIAPVSPGPVVPDLSDFSRGDQELGGRRPTTPVIGSVRARPHVGFLRVSLDLTGRDGEPLVGPLPKTRARRAGRSLKLSVEAATAPGVLGELATVVDDPAFSSGRIDRDAGSNRVTVTIVPATAGNGFYLHTSTDPTRVILDIRR